jgi:tocopherol O-methyltransferase
MFISSLGGSCAASVQDHYDRLSSIYRTFWGDHIHHGYWLRNESPREAQIRLIERLATRAGIQKGSRVLDVGCGLGGSALWLAENLGCHVLGITNSRVQCGLSRQAAARKRLTAQVSFEVADAEALHLKSESFDVVWVIESSEHFHNKSHFFRAAYDVLRPRGTVAICAWLAGVHLLSEAHQTLVDRVCRGMLCPSLGTMRDYVTWLETAHFGNVQAEDATPHVASTWDHALDILQGRPVVQLLQAADPMTHSFVAAFPAIRQAYAEGAMAYGLFRAQKD